MRSFQMIIFKIERGIRTFFLLLKADSLGTFKTFPETGKYVVAPTKPYVSIYLDFQGRD